MTQLENELQEALADHRASASEDDEDARADALLRAEADEFADAGPADEMCGEMPDLDELVDTLQGLPVEDVIEEIRDALKKIGRGASDADLLGVLLKVFRAARDAALEGYDTWEGPVSYCDELTRLCDRNFLGMGSGGSAGASDFSPNIVAAVYAECGRTLLIADDLQKSKTLLEKAMNVFAVISESDGEFTQRQIAAARSSLARVTRRIEGAEASEVHYLRALEIYAQLPPGDDTAKFLSEYLEVLGEADPDALSPSTLGVIGDVAEDRFGTGSDEHLDVLRQIADVCADAGRLEIAAPALACRARALRASREEYSGGCTRVEADAATEEAAKAFEASLPARLEQGDLEGAIEVWTEAITFRELLEGPNSSLVSSMRTALKALTQALGGHGPNSDAETSAGRSLESVEEDEESSPPAPATAERWDEEEEEAAPAVPEPKPFVPPPRITSLSSSAAGALRPAWMQAKPSSKPEKPSDADLGLEEPEVTAEDSWD